ncbi:hypothetical protein MKX01_000143, partial [Papaver californicum]
MHFWRILSLQPTDLQFSSIIITSQLRDFAHNHKGKYSDSIKDAKDFYQSKFYTDELLWADAWLYTATDDDKYLSFLQETDDRGPQIEFSWDAKDAGAQMVVAKLVLEGRLDDATEPWATYWANAQEFVCNSIQKGTGNFKLTDSGGLLYFNEWNNLNYVTASLFLVMAYAEASDTTLPCDSEEVEPGALNNFVQLQ